MRYIISFIIICCFGASGISAQTLPLIPLPAEVKQGAGVFTLTGSVKLILKTDSAKVKKTCDAFLERINRSTGLRIGYASTCDTPIIVELDPKIKHPEGYYLKVAPQSITVRAGTPAGIFYAFQTLRQLLPPEIESKTIVAGRAWTIPATEITDEPRFPYRGLMLDVVRHFFPIDDLKRYIDLMSMYKYNRLHLHLTDDQGWRIEINAYPQLQYIGAWRSGTIVGHLNDEPRRYDGIRYGGYYRQSELRELVRYAAERYITIIPEIEMPGHATAALAALPELSCTAGTVEPAREWGVFPNLFCPKEETFRFLERVLHEVMNIFPGKYIHAGGDECIKEQWQQSEYCQILKWQNELQTDEQLQTWFIRRISDYVASFGRQIIGWDEIIDGGDVPEAVIMSWRGEQGGIAAAQKGYNAIMTPHRYCYFDYYQWRIRKDEPLAASGYIPLSMVYMYNPVPKELTKEQAKYILGAQGNLWTEYIPDMRQAEYMAYPRACALGEVNWSPEESKSYDGFLARLREHSKRLDILNVNYARYFLGK